MCLIQFANGRSILSATITAYYITIYYILQQAAENNL